MYISAISFEYFAVAVLCAAPPLLSTKQRTL